MGADYWLRRDRNGDLLLKVGSGLAERYTSLCMVQHSNHVYVAAFDNAGLTQESVEDYVVDFLRWMSPPYATSAELADRVGPVYVRAYNSTKWVSVHRVDRRQELYNELGREA